MKKKISQSTRLKMSFGVLCVATFGILYTGPGFNFALQVLLTFILLVFLFWWST
ncbi:MAG: hypothetical protein ACE5ER_06090 [Nitrospinaceae bacterium]